MPSLVPFGVPFCPGEACSHLLGISDIPFRACFQRQGRIRSTFRLVIPLCFCASRCFDRSFSFFKNSRASNVSYSSVEQSGGSYIRSLTTSPSPNGLTLKRKRNRRSYSTPTIRVCVSSKKTVKHPITPAPGRGENRPLPDDCDPILTTLYGRPRI